MAIGINLQMLLNAWNIRFMMLTSLGVQIFLAYAAPYRKNTSRSFTTIMVWSAYLLTDWAAIYAFGLISNTVRVSAEIPSQVNQNILALWASFLLIHLGGPDTITAYSLEDNSLWLRHLLRVVGQLAVFFYIFLRTFPGNNLVAPTVLVLATGVVKSGDRTRALFLASLDNLKSSIGKQSKVEVLQEDRRQHNYFFERFRGMIVDIVPSLSDIEESREFFKTGGADRALIVISKELNQMYEVLYSKIMAILSNWGQLSRCVFYIGMVTALVLFILSSKDQFDRVDVRITYCLMVGVFVVDTSQTAMLLDSDWADAPLHLGKFSDSVLLVLMTLTFVPSLMLYLIFYCFSGGNEKLWSESMGAFNLLDCSFRKYCGRSRKKQKDAVTRFCRGVLGRVIDGCGLTDGLDNIMHTRRNDFNNELWKFIFEEIEQKSSSIDNEERAREAYESRGESVLMKSNLGDMKKSYVEDFEYDKGVLCWHIATEICYNIDENNKESHREWSKILSDYLMYLLIHRPKLTAAIVGIGHERYVRTCCKVMDLANTLGVENLKEFCSKVIEGRENNEGAHDHENVEGGKNCECRCGVEDKSVLCDGCDLSRILINCDNKWKIIAGVWVEMLSYAAGHCRGEAHARAVCEGGELLSHVWFLMAHFGISARWLKTDRCAHKQPAIP